MAFSPSGIKSCAVKIGTEFNEKCNQINSNLFVVEWNSKQFQEGLHYITATVVDNNDRENEVTQPFRLDDNQSLNFDFLAKFVLQTEAITIFKSFFWLSFILCVAPLVFFRIWHELVRFGLLSRKRGNRTSMSYTQQLWILSSVDRIIWPSILYCVYLAVGPWAICEIVESRYGAVFVWGVYVNGSFLPGSFTYFYGCLQLILCKFPMFWIYSKCVEKRYYQVIGMPIKNHRGWCSTRKISNVAFYFLITIETLLSIYFDILYGAVAFFLIVFRILSVVLNFYMWYLVRNVPDHALR